MKPSLQIFKNVMLVEWRITWSKSPVFDKVDRVIQKPFWPIFYVDDTGHLGVIYMLFANILFDCLHKVTWLINAYVEDFFIRIKNKFCWNQRRMTLKDWAINILIHLNVCATLPGLSKIDCEPEMDFLNDFISHNC